MFCYGQHFDIARNSVHCIDELLHGWHIAIFHCNPDWCLVDRAHSLGPCQIIFGRKQRLFNQNGKGYLRTDCL